MQIGHYFEGDSLFQSFVSITVVVVVVVVVVVCLFPAQSYKHYKNKTWYITANSYAGGRQRSQWLIVLAAYCFPIPNRIKVKNKNILWHEEGIVSDNIVVGRWYYMSFFE